MGLGSDSWSPGEQETLTDILNEVIPEVTKERIFGSHEDYEEINPRAVSDQEILDAVSWDGAPKRRKKWLLMSGEVVLRADMARDKHTMQQNGLEKLGVASSGRAALDWQTYYNEAADAVAIYIDGASCAETIKSALRRETFGNEISISIPREVLRRLEARVRERDDVTVQTVIAAHRDAIE